MSKKHKEEKVKIVCQDGPLQGQTLYLTADKTTAVFTLLNQTGRYINGKLHEA